MSRIEKMQGTPTKKLLPLLALILAGCATIPETPDETPDVEAVEPTPTAETPVPPVSDVPVVAEPQLFAARVAIVLSDKKPAYKKVATELGELLGDYSTYNLGDGELTPPEIFSHIADTDTDVVIAIGLRAAALAQSFSHVPVVFCQVFNMVDNNLTSDNMKGVAALPPLDLQIEAWKNLNPDLRNVGAILGIGHERLIEEATQAAEAAGVILHYRIVRSDRETLYTFNRLTPDIDGFWLFPDNRILSPSVLRQMLSYAWRHQVQVAVFNPSFLDLGAALSATTVVSDIAATVVSVAHRVIEGNIDSIPAVTRLNEISLQANPTILRKIELATADDAAGGHAGLTQ